MKIRPNRPVQFLFALVAGLATHSAIGQLAISDSPLFLSDSVEPNVIMALDDSGSMDFELLMPTNDGAMWWNLADQSFVGLGADDLPLPGAINYNRGGGSGGTWFKYVYLFPNGCCDRGARRNGTSYPVPPTLEWAFSRSPDYNRGYYDPAVTYEPWISTGTRTFTDVTPTAAPWDPIADSTAFTIDLTQDVPADARWDWQFLFANGMLDETNNPVPFTQYRGAAYFPATFYMADDTATLALNGIALDCSNPDPDNFLQFQSALASGTVTGSASAVGPDGRCLVRYEIRPTTPSFPSGRSYNDELQNFANWFTYYRKRHQAMRGGISRAFNAIDSVRVGQFQLNARRNVTMRSLNTERDTVMEDIFNARGTGGTPTRQSLLHMGRQFERTGASAPIIAACQKNYGVVFTDGFATLADVGIANLDGAAPPPFADSWDNTLADIAWMFYNDFNAPGSFSSGLVPVPSACSNTTPDPTLDCNEDLHMTTYGVTLNAEGTLFGQTYFTAQDAHDSPPIWPEPNLTRNPRMVDDLYHAAINGRGEMLNARTPVEIADQMSAVLATVIETEGTAAAVTFNTGLLSSDSLVYQAKLDSEDWSGFLTASSLDPITGDVSAVPLWDASERIPSENNRQIVTFDPANDGIAFRNFANLTTAQQDDLNQATTGGLTGQDVLDFIRGDRGNETDIGFRKRSDRTVLGDIVHSGPVLVGAPRSDWPDAAPFPTGANAYSDWAEGSVTSRREAVYVGANDGMLHGFYGDAGQPDSGAEFFAYIPNKRFSSAVGEGLHELADRNYTHKYYVDLTPVVADVFIPANSGGLADWRSVLVGGLRGGGAGLFALDVTDPDQMTEANAAAIVLWEFTSADDLDLGETFSDPSIALMNNGRWAAVFGNGYNNEGTTQAALFIVYLDGGLDGVWTAGSDYQKILLPGANSGLSTPQLADLDANGTPDRVYAGDLNGNMWAFDVSSNNANIWSVAYGTSGSPQPLFTAFNNAGVAQPITGKPVLARCPFDNSVSPDVMVLFGTGQYLTEGDKTTTDGQSFYAIWDKGDQELDRSDLLQQFVNDPSLNFDPTNIRVPTNFDLDPMMETGWYMDLPGNGERVVSNALVRGDIVFYNTIIPDSGDPCVVGGGGWLMSVKICSGGRPDEPAFDLNRDNAVNNGDIVIDTLLTDADGNPVTYSAGGERFNPTEVLPWQSSILGDRQYTPGSTGELERRSISGTNALLDGRLSWEQLTND
ncbi:MAG: PilC/PilY family type IV pilus protein [Pseudomonadota bacterium]